MTVNYGEVVEARGIQTGRIVRKGNKYVVYVGAMKASFRSHGKAVRFLASCR